jgi:predicted aspartyl protease
MPYYHLISNAKKFIILIAFLAIYCTNSFAGKAGWQHKKVNWRIGRGKITEIRYPPQESPLLYNKKTASEKKVLSKKLLPSQNISRLQGIFEQAAGPVYATVVESPPLNGFVPWVALSITNKRYPEIDSIFSVEPSGSVLGNYLTGNPQENFAVGIFDTGASSHVIDYISASQAGLSGSYLTSNWIEIIGATGSVQALVSQPIGIFIDGIGAVEPNGLLLDTSEMVGEWNTAVSVGDAVESPNLPTVIGSALSVYFAAEFRNDLQNMIFHNDVNFVGPDILFYERDDPCIPGHSNIIPLELKPLGGVSVSYLPTFDFDTFEFVPISPSVVMGNLDLALQSLPFVHSVDLYEADHSAIDKDRFLFDTGAEVTVIGSRIAARLDFDPQDPNFEVVIQGVTGDTITVPGFYVDEIQIPALGDWLSATNVPVILLDVFSPEGGTLDGIIGMNLFTELNFVFKGGGLFGQNDPSIEFGPIPDYIPADIYPRTSDGVVDNLDLAVFADAWLGTLQPLSSNYNFRCDFNPDGIINLQDFAAFAQYWP